MGARLKLLIGYDERVVSRAALIVQHAKTAGLAVQTVRSR